MPTVALSELQMLNVQNTVPVNFAGNPALAIPIPLANEIVPATSLQLVGPRFSEAGLLNAGRLVQATSRLCNPPHPHRTSLMASHPSGPRVGYGSRVQ